MTITKSPLGVIETVYQHMRVRLVTGQLRPGEKLKISQISQDMNVSTGVLREALTRLSAENLVVATPQRGFSVAPMSAAELMDITRVRIDIEGLCIRRSLSLGDIEWESAVVGAYHRLMHTPRGTAIARPYLRQPGMVPTITSTTPLSRPATALGYSSCANSFKFRANAIA